MRHSLGTTRLAGASATYAIAGTVGKLTGIVTVPVLTRTLGQADYGLVDLSVGLIGLAAIVGGMSAELPAVAMIARRPTSRAHVVTTYLTSAAAVATLLGVLIAAASGWIALRLWNHSEATFIAALCGVSVPLTAIQWATWNVHRIDDAPRRYALFSTADLILKATLLTAVALAFRSAGAVVAAFVAATAVGAVAGAWSVRRSLARPQLSMVRSLASGGVPFMLISVGSIASVYAVRAVVAQAGLSEVGDMAVSLRLAGLLALPLAAFQLAWGPANMGQPAGEETQRSIGRATVMLVSVGGAGAIALSLTGPEAVLLLAGSRFDGAATSLPGLAISTVLGTAFFMLSVGAATRSGATGGIMLATAVGALIQVGTTSSLLELGPQVAVSIGAMVGPGASTLLVVGPSLSFRHRAGIHVALSVAVLSSLGLGLLYLMPVVPFVARWSVAGVIGVALGFLVFRVARPHRDSPECASSS